MKKKTVLGLDLGVGSIGWALISTDQQDKPLNILAMGTRIVPLSQADSDAYNSSGKESANKKRTKQRTIRKGINRYQQRRTRLTNILRQHGMLPDETLIKLPVLALWELRAKAATEGQQLSLAELGRVLYHLNQKRGYKHAKGEGSTKQDTDYVAAVKGRYRDLSESDQTIGQHFAQQLKASEQQGEKGVFYTYRIKDQVYPREAYIEEFDRILTAQAPFYPELLTPALIEELRSTIYHQRPLKSCKGLVSYCPFERKQKLVKIRLAGKGGADSYKEQLVDIGPKVAPKSSPLAEVCRTWETLNNIRIYYADSSERVLSIEEKHKLFDILQTKDTLTLKQALKELGIKDKKEQDEYWCNALLEGGIKGNTTCAQLRKAFKDYPEYKELLSFDLELSEGNPDTDTGELRPIISELYQQTPLFKLWHILYSIEDKDAMGKALVQQLGIRQQDLNAGLLDLLYSIDFTKQGYAGKSSKFICKLLPYLQQGHMYSEACERAGKSHSVSLTSEQNEERPLIDTLPTLARNSLRQPVVEKILNQMINLVNQIKLHYGTIDEVRIELARELRASREEREEISKRNNANKRVNEAIALRIQELGFYPTKARIEKYKLWEEAKERCIYCNNTVKLSDFLGGEKVEVEHIIPRSVLYDDSFANKTCSCSECNREKNNSTAMEYMQSQGRDKLEDYIKRVNTLFTGLKHKGKHDRLLMLPEDIPTDFLERHLRLTQYIAREAQSILAQGIRTVSPTSGGITAILRHLWGYDKVLHELNLERYRSMGETEVVEYDGQSKERIKDWSKRKDHRHHALDALIVACTQKEYIQRINRVNAKSGATNEEQPQGDPTKPKQTALEKWLSHSIPFSHQAVKEQVAGVLVSQRPGARTYSFGRNKFQQKGKPLTQTGILIPRGSLSEETVYGQIEAPTGSAIVCKYPLQSIKAKDTPFIVDQGLRQLIEERLRAYNMDEKQAFAEPLYADEAQTQQVRSVRCFTGRKESKMIPLRFDSQGKPIAYVAPGNNHHIALYQDPQGKVHESILTFWHAIERIRFGLPIVVTDPKATWELAHTMELPEDVLQRLPEADWTLVEVLRKGEMFLLGMSDEEIEIAFLKKDYLSLSQHLYRVAEASSKDYVFKYHLDCRQNDDSNRVGIIPSRYRLKSFKAYTALNPRKVRINILGQISLV